MDVVIATVLIATVVNCVWFVVDWVHVSVTAAVKAVVAAMRANAAEQRATKAEAAAEQRATKAEQRATEAEQRATKAEQRATEAATEAKRDAEKKVFNDEIRRVLFEGKVSVFKAQLFSAEMNAG
eukprot:3361015-Rhodomonas_salina.2